MMVDEDEITGLDQGEVLSLQSHGKLTPYTIPQNTHEWVDPEAIGADVVLAKQTDVVRDKGRNGRQWASTALLPGL